MVVGMGVRASCMGFRLPIAFIRPTRRTPLPPTEVRTPTGYAGRSIIYVLQAGGTITGRESVSLLTLTKTT